MLDFHVCRPVIYEKEMRCLGFSAVYTVTGYETVCTLTCFNPTFRALETLNYPRKRKKDSSASVFPQDNALTCPWNRDNGVRTKAAETSLATLPHIRINQISQELLLLHEALWVDVLINLLTEVKIQCLITCFANNTDNYRAHYYYFYYKIDQNLMKRQTQTIKKSNLTCFQLNNVELEKCFIKRPLSPRATFVGKWNWVPAGHAGLV